MKTEKQTERIETKRFDLDEEKEILDLDGRLTVHEVKDLILKCCKEARQKNHPNGIS